MEQLLKEIRAMRRELATLNAKINVLTTSKAQLMTKQWKKKELKEFLGISEAQFYRVAPMLGTRLGKRGEFRLDPHYVKLQLKSGKINVSELPDNGKN